MQHAIIFFDGVCNLCTSSVKFVIKRDRKDCFRFAPLQGETAGQYIDVADTPENTAPGSIILLEGGKIYKRSTAALRIARRLGFGWNLLYGFIIVPAFIRDIIYDQIAKRRYSIWGREESCMVPTAGLKAKFL
ncbi:MAG: DCC1-like thiol-disulfide oxidoreductase family protein [Pedobacter sp.]|uniref:thiol-disulfide oxidoreductase DCC family protein n=1 Tax=Pedobacter sp. TaxID=1411316 RepID=UPI003390D748